MDYKSDDYHKQKSKEHYQKYKAKYNARCKDQRQKTREILLEAKQSGCIACKESEPACLDFHHLHSKDAVISQMLGWSSEKVYQEISKCVILCANCHRKHHAGLLDISV